MKPLKNYFFFLKPSLMFSVICSEVISAGTRHWAEHLFYCNVRLVSVLAMHQPILAIKIALKSSLNTINAFAFNTQHSSLKRNFFLCCCKRFLVIKSNIWQLCPSPLTLLLFSDLSCVFSFPEQVICQIQVKFMNF